MQKIETRIKSGDSEIWCSICGLNDTPKAHVIILTGDGLSGSQSSTWAPLVNKLINENFCVLQFDFISQGNSGGNRQQLNIETGLENYRDALNYFTQKLQINSLIAVASSFGATVLLSSLTNFSKYSKIILKSPACDLASAYENEHGGFEGMLKWKNEEISTLSGLLYQSYLKALETNVFSKINYIESRVLVFHGTEDEIVESKYIDRLTFLLGDKCKTLKLEGVRHNYKQNNAMQYFVDKSVDFLIN